MVDHWSAALAPGPVAGLVRVPGSKSLTNRALVLAALANGPSRISNVLRSRDSELMIGALRTLGATIDDSPGADSHPPGSVRVEPIRPGGTDVRVDCGLAGTVMRFVPPLAALTGAGVAFDGDPRARDRPMAPLLDGLRQLGLATTPGDAAGLPFSIRRCRTTGGRARLDASPSSQFISALLLAAPRLDRPLTLEHTGPTLPALPHIAMTERMLADRGVGVTRDGTTWTVPVTPVRAIDQVIEPDLSNAVPFAAAAMATGGRVTIPGLGGDSLQPISEVIGALEAMGAGVGMAADGLTVRGTGQLLGINRDLGAIGELVPTLAALAALARTPSRMTGIAHLAGHETDRLQAIATEINALGGRVDRVEGGLAITPAPLRAERPWRTYHDHRMATAGAILGLLVPGLLVEDMATTAKTFPGFASAWEALVTPSPDHAP